MERILAKYPRGSWAPTKMNLTNADLKLMGLPSKKVLTSRRYSKPTIFDRKTGRAKIVEPGVLSFAGAGYFGIRPGAWLLLLSGGSIGWCSAAHVYGAPGSNDISTAGHCGKAGDIATVVGLVGNRNPVLIDFGAFRRSTDGGLGKDHAMIDIDPQWQSLVTPTMAFWGGPRGVFTKTGSVAGISASGNGGVTPYVNPDPFLAQQILHYGHGIGIGAGGTPRSGTSVSAAAPAENWTRSAGPCMTGASLRQGEMTVLARFLKVSGCALAIGLTGGAGSALAGEQYVALGDSYSSGTGTREYYDTNCERSNHSFSKIIDTERANTDVVLAACGGARTGDVLASQVSNLTTATKWVSITIGGNDAGFSRVITECAKPWWAADCDAEVDKAQAYINTTLPGQLANVNNEIKRRAPYATVIPLSYPRVFMGVDCNAGTYFSSAEMTRLNATADLLRDKIRTAATNAGTQFRFKDAIGPFIGHAVCSSSEWINGLSNPTGESYHPNRSGHRSGYVPLVRAVMG